MKTAEASRPAAQPAGGRTPDGRLWFTTAKGVVVADPGHLSPESHDSARSAGRGCRSATGACGRSQGFGWPLGPTAWSSITRA
ncbi:MAG: hypothetical protein WDO73_28360 [Ignavibacteriota bacterium]